MAFLPVLALILGCSAEPPAPKPVSAATWTVVAESSLTPAQAGQKAAAVAARDALFEKLMARLTQVVTADGPVAAISVCQVEAPGIAESVGREKDVRIGRTSHKLRNPKNQPPEWAAGPVAAKPAEPVFLAGPDGRFGAILPIRLKAQCLTCHGPVDKLPAGVREALAERYPEDQAVGFAENDLRGWFWVEVPRR